MAKWLRKWRRGWLYVRSNTKNAKSLMFNANQSQTLILITWPNMSALGPKMGNPPPYQGIPYTITPPSSIFVYKNSLRKLWNYLINHAEKSTSFWSNQGIIMRATTYLPAAFPSRHFAKQDFKQALVGQLCMGWDLPRVQLSIFAIITGVSRTTLFR